MQTQITRQLSVPYRPCNHVSNILLWPTLCFVVEYRHLQPLTVQSNHHTSVMKSMHRSHASFSSFPRLDYFGAPQISVDLREETGFSRHFQSKSCVDFSEKQTLNEELELHSFHDSPESLGKRQKARKRHGNKGSVPWNKGKNHTAETRALIRQRTAEALRDPQVRKKMSAHPRVLSEEDKAKISSSLRKLWGKRLKWKRLGEKFFLSWAKGIAEAAKQGDGDQEVLDWDSYDKIKQAITLQHLQCAMEMAQEKELTKMKTKGTAKEKKVNMAGIAQKRKEEAEKAAKKKVAKMARLVQKRKEQKERANEQAREEAKGQTQRNAKRNVKEFSGVQELTLKQRLMKIRKRKSLNAQVFYGQGASLISGSRAWEKLDLDLRRREKDQREASLADQIRAAKSKRTESISTKALPVPSAFFYSMED